MPISQIDLTLRIPKGSALTYQEGDDNFTNLRDAILSLSEEFSASRIVYGTEPAIDERDGVIWLPPFPTTPTSRWGFYVWQNINGTDRWVRIKEPPLYNVTTGSAGAYSVQILDDIVDLNDLKGRLVGLKLNHTAPGAATLVVTDRTATVITTSPIDIRKGGAIALGGGELPAGSVALVIYDGTYFQLISSIPVAASGPATSFYSYISGPASVSASGGNVTFEHGLIHESVPIKPDLIHISLVRTAVAPLIVVPDGANPPKWQINQNDSIDAAQVWAGARGDENEYYTPAFRISYDTTNILVNCYYPKGMGYIQKNFSENNGPQGAGYTVRIDPGDFRMVCHAMAFNPTLLTGSSVIPDTGGGVAAPVITVQPANTTIDTGDPGALSVTASGSDLTYQWFKDGVSLAGETATTYTINSASAGDAGVYFVIVSNAGGSVQSNSATVTVNP